MIRFCTVTLFASLFASLSAQGGANKLVSVSSNLLLGNGISQCAGAYGTNLSSTSISADGRFVVFYSAANNLVPNDTNNVSDVFLRDVQTGTTTMVTISDLGVQGNLGSSFPSISADGRFVVFESQASNLVPGDNNGTTDVFLRDLQSGTTRRLSVSSSGQQGNELSRHASISADGRYVAFDSYATTLVANENNNEADVFVRDLLFGTTTKVSVSSAGVGGYGQSTFPSLSGDGRQITFRSAATNFAAGTTAGTQHIYVRDQQTQTTTLVSVSSSGLVANSSSGSPVISADGRYVAFESFANNLVANDPQSTHDAFIRDLQAGTTSLISVSSTNAKGNDESYPSSISSDGRYVVLSSLANNLVSNDTNGFMDVFLRDRVGGKTSRISIASTGAEGNNHSFKGAISGDGRYVAFDSTGTNIVPEDTNNVGDAFIQKLPKRTLTGTLILENIYPSAGNQVIAWQLLNGGGGALVESGTLSVATGLTYALSCNTDSGSGYVLTMKGTHWLKAGLTGINLNADQTAINFTLPNGDCNGDNVVDLTDYTILVVAFNALPASANWDIRADLNVDGVVDLTDYTILVANFNMIGY